MRDAVEIGPAASPGDVETARALFREYAGALGFDLEFQGFPGELAGLPGDYAPPGGALLLARVRGEPAGCVALRPLPAAGPGTGEMKRLFVRPEHRGGGVGRALAVAVVEAARSAGYVRMLLDTVPAMRQAAALYETLGFRDIPPYRFNPVAGTRYMELSLEAGRERAGEEAGPGSAC
jgi:GNAT superfamily N-acetyltransferase